ncbi:hypothetical protein GIS00_23630 [Nakamurella sp. YIM 132087]|uniref:Uncharacterized protein n=1 Tax=Nakamurella alba TaxID=2665158 RepID=A0A7K1FS82_9ACTN|nr:DUF6069 family protein [Nakamurella alba]MTD16930.1 hypothetical protein [Nakamurella alba]
MTTSIITPSASTPNYGDRSYGDRNHGTPAGTGYGSTYSTSRPGFQAAAQHVANPDRVHATTAGRNYGSAGYGNDLGYGDDLGYGTGANRAPQQTPLRRIEAQADGFAPAWSAAPQGYRDDRPAAVAPAAPIAKATDEPIAVPTGLFTRRNPGIDQGRFWVGTVLTAAVAALIGIIGMVVAGGIFHIPALAAAGDGTLSEGHLAFYGLSIAVIALAAGLIYDGMLHFAPRPMLFFGWLAGLGAVLAAVTPFALGESLHTQIALAVINLLAGTAIMGLIPLAAIAARPRS